MNQVEVLRGTITKLVAGETPDLSARQMAVFLNVYLKEGPHTVRGLAHNLNVSKPAITRALDRLSEPGLDLVRRKTDPEDRRSVLVIRTQEGTNYLNLIGKIMADEQAEQRQQKAA